MTLILCCGAECNIAVVGLGTAAKLHWSSISGTAPPAISTSIYRVPALGTGGLKSFAIPADASGFSSLNKNFVAAQSVGYFRGYFYITDSTPAIQSSIVTVGAAASGSDVIFITTGGVLRAQSGTSGGNIAGPTLADNTWYGIEAEFDKHANPHVLRWRTWSAAGGWVDQTNATNAVAATTLTTCWMGMWGPTGSNTIYWDDVVIGNGTSAAEHYSTTTPKGGVVKRYRPTSDGTHSFTLNDFVYNAAGGSVATNATDVYTYLDEDDQTVLTDFISQAVQRTGGYIRVNLADEAQYTSPRAVAITSAHHSGGTGANEQHLRASDDGTTWTNILGDWNVTGDDVSDTTIHPRHVVMGTMPSTAGAWTTAGVNGLTIEWGNSDDVSAVPYIDSVSAEVDWDDTLILATAGSDPMGMMGFFGM